MKVKEIHLIEVTVVIVILAAVFMFLSSNVATADQSEAIYVGSDTCNTCHSTQYDYWDDTSHGTDFATEWIYHGNLTNKYTHCGDSMLPCHTIGYNQIDKGGYSPAYAWDSTENANLLGIGCENCHGPASVHTGSMDADDINQVVDQYAGSCGGTTDAGCHADNRQYGNGTILGWSGTAHALEAPEYAQSLDCSHCMSTEGAIAKMDGTPLTELPESVTWKQTCAACHDPHPDETNTNDYQLRVSEEEICEVCHYTTSELGDEDIHHPTKEMREGTAGIDVADISYMSDVSCVECHMYSTGHGVTPVKQGHSFTPQPEACVVCHDGVTALPEYNVTTAQEEIDELHESHESTYNTVNPNIETMKEKKTFAEENNIWTNEMNDTYCEALWNFGLATEDGGKGAHNPDYAEALMQDANTKALSVISAVNNATPSGGTPGFEIIVFIAALGLAFAILRRRK